MFAQSYRGDPVTRLHSDGRNPKSWYRPRQLKSCQVRQSHTNDAKVAASVASFAGATYVRSSLVTLTLTVIVTRKVLLMITIVILAIVVKVGKHSKHSGGMKSS